MPFKPFSSTVFSQSAEPPPPPPSYEESAPIPEYQAPWSPPLRPVTSHISNFTIDKTFINPISSSSAPCLNTDAAYELSNELDAGHSTISISRLLPFSDAVPGLVTSRRPKHIYSFTQPIFSTTVEIVGKRRNTLPGTVTLRTAHSFLKLSWEIWHQTPHNGEGVLLFRTRPTRNLQKADNLQWEDAGKDLVAVETLWKAETRPGLHVVKELGDHMADVLVTGWCARIWIGCQTGIAEARKKELDYSCLCHSLPILLH